MRITDKSRQSKRCSPTIAPAATVSLARLGIQRQDRRLVSELLNWYDVPLSPCRRRRARSGARGCSNLEAAAEYRSKQQRDSPVFMRSTTEGLRQQKQTRSFGVAITRMTGKLSNLAVLSLLLAVSLHFALEVLLRLCCLGYSSVCICVWPHRKPKSR